MGAFDLLAWQFLWAVGLWIGAGYCESISKVLTSKISAIAALLVAGAFFLLRHPILPIQLDGAVWSGLIGQMASGQFTAAGLYVVCDSLCRQQALAGTLADDPSSCLARQSIAGSVLCAPAVLLRRAFFCRGRNRFARLDTGGFDRCHLIGLYTVADWRQQHLQDRSWASSRRVGEGLPCATIKARPNCSKQQGVVYCPSGVEARRSKSPKTFK